MGAETAVALVPPSSTQPLHEGGITSVRDFERLKGKKFGVPALGSVNQYNASFSLTIAKLDPGKDVEWSRVCRKPN